MTTHIVCRDCRFEAVVFVMDAERTVETHEENTGHTVESESVDRGTRVVTDGGQEPRDDDFEAYEEKLDELNDALLEAYAAGFAKAVETSDIDPGFDADPKQLKELEVIQESHFYYWDGRQKPLKGWLREQFLDDEEDLVTDGGREYALPGDDIWQRLHESNIGIGDVVVDLARGKSLQVVSVATQTAGEHKQVRSDPTAEMFGTDADDLVFNCVFLPNQDDGISPPSKTYAYPESRLLRYPVEDATPNERLQREWLSNVLEQLAVVVTKFDDDRQRQGVFRAVDEAFGEDVVETLEEFAEAQGGGV